MYCVSGQYVSSMATNYEVYLLTAQDIKMGVVIVVALVGVVCPDVLF